MNTDIDLKTVQLNWCLDILNRMNIIVNDPGWTSDQKIATIMWLIKQALKVERED